MSLLSASLVACSEIARWVFRLIAASKISGTKPEVETVILRFEKSKPAESFKILIAF